jgi:hypothetical protein
METPTPCVQEVRLFHSALTSELRTHKLSSELRTHKLSSELRLINHADINGRLDKRFSVTHSDFTLGFGKHCAKELTLSPMLPPREGRVISVILCHNLSLGRIR